MMVMMMMIGEYYWFPLCSGVMTCHLIGTPHRCLPPYIRRFETHSRSAPPGKIRSLRHCSRYLKVGSVFMSAYENITPKLGPFSVNNLLRHRWPIRSYILN